jgi:N6-L-threonylcarbamoyladenine synthase
VLILTIESSCDETSAAVVEDGQRILANTVASQIPVHAKYGGVVPELASRNHIRDIQPVIEQTLADAGVELEDIEGFGVTAGPGLVGSLIVGLETAKSLAYAHGVPCIGLNHLEGHLTVPLMELDDCPTPAFPYIGLIASGGHSDLYIVRGLGDYELLGRTRDDAAGEAFDKVAKMLGLPYPGGIEIDRLAEEGDPEAIDFPRPMWSHDNYDFSFAGLKTAVRNYLRDNGTPKEESQARKDLCASFQQAVVDVLVKKAFDAAREYEIPRVVVSGGVACNTALRESAKTRADQLGYSFSVAPPRLCTDNAAMLGAIADHYVEESSTDDFYDMTARANLPVV